MFRNQLTTISPFQSQSKPLVPLLNALKDLPNDDDSVVIPNKFGAVPIYQDKVKFVDFGKEGSENTSTDKQQNGDVADRLNVSGDGELNKIKEYQISKFVEFGSYELKNPVEKLFNVGVVGFKNLPDALIEQILNVMINEFDGSKDEKSDFQWSFVDDVDNKVVFFKFLSNDLKNVKRLTKLDALQKIEVDGEYLVFSPSSGLSEYIRDTLGDDFKIEVEMESLQNKIKELIKYSKKAIPSVNKVNPDEYSIDESQLKDIPADVLPQIRKDIKDFRMKVIEIENKKRAKEKQEGIRRSKAQLRKLFDNYKKTDAAQMEVDDEEDEDRAEEDDGLTDEQFEESRMEKEKLEMTRQYASKLSAIRAIETHNKELLNTEKSLVAYEDNLNKIIKPEYEQGKWAPSGVNRETEAEKDENDREEEKKEVTESLNTSKPNAKVPLKVNIKQREEEKEQEQQQEESTTDKSELNVSEEKLTAALVSIRGKIESYLEELLGVADEELTDYITMIIQDTKSKSSLTTELRETFDDDAEKISESIWKDLLEAVLGLN